MSKPGYRKRIQDNGEKGYGAAGGENVTERRNTL